MAPGSTFTVTFEFYGTGPTYPYEHRWVSETDGGNDLVCHSSDETACQWHSDSFTLTAPSTPGSYTWYVAGYGNDQSSYCGGGYDESEAFTFDVVQECTHVEIKNVSVSPSSSMAPGSTFTVSYDYYGTGPTYPFEHRWVSETSGGADIACDSGDATACQWHSDAFTLTAPSTPGNYTWYVAGWGSASSSGGCGGGYDDNEAFTFDVVQDCQNVEIRNVSVSPSIVDEGEQFTVSYQYYGTGPTYPYEFRWISETDGGNYRTGLCEAGDATACQWHSDSFTLYAPYSPGTYTWYVAGYGSNQSTGLCGVPYDDNEAFTFEVVQDCQNVEIKNVSASPYIVAPGDPFTVSYEYFGTGSTYPYECRWVSETDGGAGIACDSGDATACQWHSDSFTLTAPSTPGGYIWYVAGYSSTVSSGSCGGSYDDNEAFLFDVVPDCPLVEIKNVSASPSTMAPGDPFTVTYEYSGTGFPYEYRWVSETDGGSDIACDVDDATDCQWYSDSFTLTAPSTPGTYTWYVAGYSSNQSTGLCGGWHDDNEAFAFDVVQACESVEIKNVSVNPSSILPGEPFTVSYEYFGTGPTRPYEHRWVSGTDGGEALDCV